MGKTSKKKFFWKNRRVLITGGTGFIGSWLTKELMGFGAKVLVIDLKKSSPILDGFSKKPVLVRANTRDPKAMETIFYKFRPEVVFHLAAQAVVSVANENPLETFDTNVRGTYNILEACRETKSVKRIIICSSDKAYGESKKLPYSEDFPLRGTNPYDFSKSCADLLSQMYSKGFNLPLGITRSGNIYGGGDLHFSRLIPETIRAATLGKPLIIRSDGKSLRDYIYIEDVVKAFLLLAEKMENKKLYGQAFNFGAKYPLSVLDAAKKIVSLMKKESVSIKILNKASWEIKNQHLSLKKTKNLLGWLPETSFQEGIKKTIVWYENYFKTNAR